MMFPWWGFILYIIFILWLSTFSHMVVSKYTTHKWYRWNWRFIIPPWWMNWNYDQKSKEETEKFVKEMNDLWNRDD